MKRAKQLILIFALLLFSLSELFPPWRYVDNATSVERSAGYHFVFASEPDVKSYPEMQQVFSISDTEKHQHGISINKDYLQLFLQRFSILFLMIGFLLALDEPKRKFIITFGVASILIGFGFLGLCIFNVLRLNG